MTTMITQGKSDFAQQSLTYLNRIKSAASWFTSIAVLSVVNSLAFHLGGSFAFVVGLGVTQAADGLIAALPQIRAVFVPIFTGVAIVTYVVSFLLFLLAGILARKNRNIWVRQQSFMPWMQ